MSLTIEQPRIRVTDGDCHELGEICDFRDVGKLAFYPNPGVRLASEDLDALLRTIKRLNDAMENSPHE